MLIVLRRGFDIPLSAVALCAIAVTALPAVMPSLTVVVAAAAIAVTAQYIVRRLRASRGRFAVLPAVDGNPGARPLETDTLDLVRMDDDGGWQAPASPAATGRKARRTISSSQNIRN